MSRGVLAARIHSNPYGVFLVNDYETIQIGTSPTGVVEVSTSSNDNSVIQVKGQLYFNGGGVLHKYNKTTTNWDVLYHPNGMSGTSRRTSGLYFLNIDNIPYLIWMVNPFASTVCRGYKYNLNSGAVTETIGTCAAIEPYAMRSVLFGNSIYWMLDYLNLEAVTVYNPAAEVIASISDTIGQGNSDSPKPICVWNKNLYTHTKMLASNLYLMKYSGGRWNYIQTIAADAGGGLLAHHGSCMFQDRNYLYGIYATASQTYKMYQVDSNLTITALTGVLPTEFTIASTASRAWTYIDNEDNQDNPEIFIYFCFSATAGTPVTKYKWNGPNSLLTVVGVAGDTTWSWPFSTEGGGHRTWTADEIDITIRDINTTSAPGAARIGFNIFETDTLPSGTQVHVKIAYNSDFEHPNQWITLSNPLPSGTIVGGNTITGIEAGSGINYTVDWYPAIDNINASATITLIPWVSGII